MIRWKKQEVRQSINHQGLQLAVLGKFSYGNLDIHELQKAITIQCEVKVPCLIGLTEDTHLLIKFSLMEDYVHPFSKPAFYLNIQGDIWQMSCMKLNQ